MMLIRPAKVSATYYVAAAAKENLKEEQVFWGGESYEAKIKSDDENKRADILPESSLKDKEKIKEDFNPLVLFILIIITMIIIVIWTSPRVRRKI